MNRLEFWILNITSVLLATVIAFEMYSSDQLERVQAQAKEAQLPLLQDQQLQVMARGMIQRIAQGAAADPALKDLLIKYGFKVTIQPLPKDGLTTADPIEPSHP